MKTIWTRHLNTRPLLPPIIAAGSLILATKEETTEASPSTLHALTLTDGSTRWEHPIRHAEISGIARYRHGLLVTTMAVDLLQGEGSLRAFDTAGTQLWHLSGDWQQVGMPCIDQEMAYCVANASTLLMVNWQTGTLHGQVSLPRVAVHVAPAVGPAGIYLACRGPFLQALDRSGAVRWQYRHTGDVWLNQTPAVRDGRVFAVSSDGHLLGLDAESGRLLWLTAVGKRRRTLTPPITDGKRIYLGSRSGIHAIDPATGDTIWEFPTPKLVAAQPVLHGGDLIVGCHDHVLRALDAGTGTLLREQTLSHSLPVAAAVGTVPAASGTGQRALTIAVDRVGEVVAIERPFSAQELLDHDQWEEAAAILVQQGDRAEAAAIYETHDRLEQAAELLVELGDIRHAIELYRRIGRWQTIAELYAAHGALREAAREFAAHDDHLHAAELYLQAGDQQQAASQFELADDWRHAAELWHALGDRLAYAEALEGAARALADEQTSEDQQVVAWEKASLAYDEIGATAQAAVCRHEMARQLKLPILSVNVVSDGLVRDAWSQIRFIMINEGFSEARFVSVRRAAEHHFEGQVTRTNHFFRIEPGEEREAVLDIKPLEFGEKVPLTLTVDYSDPRRISRRMVKTVHLSVAPTPERRKSENLTNVFHTSVMREHIKVADSEGSRSLPDLKRKLMRSFDLAALKELCFELNIDYEELSHGRKQDLTRDLLLRIQREDRMAELLDKLTALRPNVRW